MKLLFTYAILFISYSVFSQNTLSGKILDAKNKVVSGSNVYLDGTYDGATSD